MNPSGLCFRVVKNMNLFWYLDSSFVNDLVLKILNIELGYEFRFGFTVVLIKRFVSPFLSANHPSHKTPSYMRKVNLVA